VWYKDDDGDGYTDGTTKVSCEKPAGYVSQALPGDCDDNDKNINPNTVWFKDEDKDGYYPEGFTAVSCTAPAGYVLSAKPGDCNDNDPNINPAKAEICDGEDNNCNGQIDEGFNVGQSCTVGVGECARTGQFVCKADGSGTQCNATPGTPTTEICDGKDNNCNGQTDEGNVCGTAKVSAGGYHTCAIKQDGSLWCWGWNLSGQLGDGTNSDKFTPVQIMSSGVSSVALGGYHTCAIKTDGSLWCWGLNSDGQLGDGTGTNRNTPVRVINPSGSGGGGAPSIFFGDKSSFGNMEQRRTIYGCSSANIVFYVLHLIFPTFILFALLKRKFVR